MLLGRKAYTHRARAAAQERTAAPRAAILRPLGRWLSRLLRYRSAMPISRSRTRAAAMSTPVPPRMACMSSWRMPVVMTLPKPPPPTKEAKTAVPMALTAAMRMPVKMMGAAMGISTWTRR